MEYKKVKKEGKSIPLQAWTGPEFPGGWGSQISRQSALEGGNVVNPTHRPPLPPPPPKGIFLVLISVMRWVNRPPLPPGNIPGTHFCKGLSQPQGHSAAGRIMSMKNFTDNIGNRTRDLPACTAVPQPPAPPHNDPKLAA
jgi:hypothetical protein